jgi:hypothetical protein
MHRPWQGTLIVLAVYHRALSPAEVGRNHAAGTGSEGPPPLAGNPAVEALYTFDEGDGDTIRDRSGTGEPLDLKIEDPSAVEWRDGGLTVGGSTLVATTGPAKRLNDAVKRSNALTLEAWITPANTSQSGPARILTLSSASNERNFTLGQDGDRYQVRFRTSETNARGAPYLNGSSGSVETRLTHVVFTRDATGTASLYVNGERQATHEVGGDLSNWDDGFRLAIANEFSNDRPWKGTFHRIAVYSRALTAKEIRTQSAGPARYGRKAETLGVLQKPGI